MKLTQHSLRPRQRGFTLVEILTVISIIVVLMAMTIGIGRWALLNSQIEKCRVQIKLFENKLQEYEADNGEFPPGDGTDRSSIDLFDSLYENGIETNGKVYMPELDPDASDQFKKITDAGVIFDPFKKKPFYYLRGVDENGEESSESYNPDFDIWSLGPNFVGRGDGGTSDTDTDDDIGNW